MINTVDFPKLTPTQRIAEGRRVLQLPSLAALEEEAQKNIDRVNYLFQKYIIAKKDINVLRLSLDQLLERFEEICLVEDETLFVPQEEGIPMYNACFAALCAVSDELKARGENARRTLTRFYTHDNYQVRLQAAIYSYRVAPEPARRCLEAIRDQKYLHQALDAGMTLRGIDDGTSKLD
jgi:hypothetical protein